MSSRRLTILDGWTGLLARVAARAESSSDESKFPHARRKNEAFAMHRRFHYVSNMPA